jgi:hypothetical protein
MYRYDLESAGRKHRGWRLPVLCLALAASSTLGAVVVASASAELPTLLLLSGGTLPVELKGESKTSKTKLEGLLGELSGEGYLVQLHWTNLNSGRSGPASLLFTNVKEPIGSKPSCNTAGDGSGLVLIDDAEWQLVFTSLSTLRSGVLFLIPQISITCGVVKEKVKGSSLASIGPYETWEESTGSFSGVSSCKSPGKPQLTKYWNASGAEATAKLEAEINGLGKFEQVCENVEGSVSLKPTQMLSIGHGGAEPTTLATSLSGEGKEGETITVLEGSKVKDKATLSGTNASKAEGKVKYDVYSESGCKTLVKAAGEVTVASGSVPASNEEELEGGASYYWQAIYSGDSKNSGSTSSCTEISTVKAKTSLSTTLSGESKEGEELTVLEGSKVKDKATLSGTNSSTAGGKVLYKIYSDSKCEHLVKEAGEETVTSGSVPASSEEELESGASYYWQATYKGDSLHQESTSSCGKEIANVNPASVVSVGDSFISGEAGRFAGSTNTLGSAAIDALGETAYYDNPTHTAELIPGCHRARSAEVYVGGKVEGENLACSGALTYSSVSEEEFKPGLDFEFKKFGQGITSGGKCDLEVCEGQALMLQRYAEEHHNVRMVVVSIGGNNFEFGAIVEACISAYLTSSICSTNASVTNRVNAAAVAARVAEIEEGITHIAEAMNKAGYNNNQYTILVQNYPQLIPSEELFRYPEGGLFERQRVGGCGFTNADANWANATALPAINEAVERAAAGTGLANVKEMKVTNALLLNLLCFSGVGLLEERGLASWMEEGAANETEWVSQVRISPAPPFTRQEALHPNYWGQMALRNCLRQAYNRGNPTGGDCEFEARGLTLAGEPRMSLR